MQPPPLTPPHGGEGNGCAQRKTNLIPFKYLTQDKMKKTYIAPVMEEHKMVVNQILSTISANLNSTYEITNSNEIGARELIEFEW